MSKTARRKPRARAQAGGNAKGRTTVRRRASTIDAKSFKKVFDEITDNVESVVKGKADVVRLALVAILCEGHILFEDVPGTGKSVLARALAQSVNATSARVQCTPDMLPGDITGSSILDQKKGVFEFKPGPIFSNILLVDEVNRATPKTQSALLEAMAERAVSADGVTHRLPRPFLVLATQNPIELAGTFPLPEAQLDRFLFKLSMGYLSHDHEFDVMYDNAHRLAIDELGAVVDTNVVEKMIAYATTVDAAPEVGHYIVDLVQASREDPAVSMGGSPRAAIALLKAARVLAASDGREHVYPDDVQSALRSVLAHRVILSPDAILRDESIDSVIERLSNAIKAPSGAKRSRG